MYKYVGYIYHTARYADLGGALFLDIVWHFLSPEHYGRYNKHQ